MSRPPPSPPLFPTTTLSRSRLRVSATLGVRHGDNTADTSDPDRMLAGAHRCLEHPDVTYDAAILFDYEVPLLRSGSERSEEHTSELQSRPHLVCRLLLEKKN